MMPRARLALPLALAVLAGCVQPADDADGAASGAQEPAAEAETTAAAPSDLPADQAGLSLQANHASGSVLRVTGARFGDDHIALDLAFTNGTDFEQKLNTLGHFVLRDDRANVYRLSPPPGNDDVRVAQGTTMEGEFVFLGRLHPDATQLTATTNEDHGGSAEYSRSPRIAIEIPFTR